MEARQKLLRLTAFYKYKKHDKQIKYDAKISNFVINKYARQQDA